MRLVFLVPLTIIALYETSEVNQQTWVRNWLRGFDEGDENYPHSRDPVVDDPEDQGREISKVPFTELIKVFPNTAQVSRSFSRVNVSDMVASRAKRCCCRRYPV